MFNLIDSQRGHSNQIHRSKNIDVLKPWAFNQNRQDSQLGIKKIMNCNITSYMYNMCDYDIQL
jgi:hypothetical protein